MFASPLVLPHADGNISCIRINQDNYGSEYLYRSAVGQVRIKIRHSVKKATAVTVEADRHNVEITQTVYATESTDELTRKVYIVVEQQASDTDVKLVDALADWLIATANANTLSLLSWSS